MTEPPEQVEWFSAPVAAPLTGSEELRGVAGALVVDFWRFAMSDLRMNNIRGYLAEYLVARAVGATGTRVEWDAYDVLAPDGTRIEVKSSAYLQVWEQRKLSRISFSGLRGRTWDRYGVAPEATYNADVYVFCVQSATSHDNYDPLDVEQWQFYVLSRQVIEATGYHSIGLPAIQALTAATPYAQLGAAIEATNEQPSTHRVVRDE